MQRFLQKNNISRNASTSKVSGQNDSSTTPIRLCCISWFHVLPWSLRFLHIKHKNQCCAHTCALPLLGLDFYKIIWYNGNFSAQHKTGYHNNQLDSYAKKRYSHLCQFCTMEVLLYQNHQWPVFQCLSRQISSKFTKKLKKKLENGFFTVHPSQNATLDFVPAIIIKEINLGD